MKLLSLIAISIFISLSSQANEHNGVSLIPYAGLFTGTITSDGLSTGNGAVQSTIAGAKLGYITNVGFGYGMDYSQGIGNYTPNSKSNPQQTWATKDMGLFVMYNFSETFSIWGTYIAQYDVEAYSTADNSITRAAIKGDGFNAGITISLLEYFSFNIAYQVRNLKTQNGAALTGTNRSEATYILANFPVNFPYKF